MSASERTRHPDAERPRTGWPSRLVLAGLCLALALAGMAPPAVAEDEELTVVSWGGAYTRSQILGYIRAFEEETGVDVEVLEYNGGLQEIRSQVRSRNVKWDVVDLELADAVRGCAQGLLEEIDPDRLAPAPGGVAPEEDFLEGALERCGVGSVFWTTAFAFDPEEFPDQAPRTVEDFFDVEAFPGRRGMRRTPKGNLEWALMADGVTPERVYEVLDTSEGLDRAFRILTSLKPHVDWWRTGSEAVRLLESGRVAMSTVWNGAVYDANVNRGLGLELFWDHQILSLDLWGVVRHSPNRELALDFLRFATSTRSLANQVRFIPHGPARRSSRELVEEEMEPYLPTLPERMDGALRLNAQWWAENFDRVNGRFQRWLERPVGVPRYLPH
ncbi:MAG: ABC transporter substrate-binding protein [Thiohalorhabdus sp.]|uniref:ABC transporter substrate-binding protein n=1 Tax=Thiohalorhabdus sp. TaxID=3094134 RepID=UPI00397F63AF